MCELLIGLPDVNILEVTETLDRLQVTIETRNTRPVCPSCGGGVQVKDRAMVRLVDLPCFGRPTVLLWRKFRWSCSSPACAVGSFTETVPVIAAARVAMTDRAGRWVTVQVGRHGRSVNEVAVDLGCDWHTVMDAVAAYGQVLIDDPDRFGDVEAIGLDETLMFRLGPWKQQQWSTQIVDVGRGQLLDVVRDRNASAPAAWLAGKPQAWRDRIRWATLDLSGPYRKVFDTVLPDAVQVADPFHLVKLANQRLDEVRRRVQNETFGHRGHKDDPLYRARRLLTRADERLDDHGRSKLLGLLAAGDPRSEVRTAWHAKETVRQLYAHTDPELALEFVERLGHDLKDADCPPEINKLGGTLLRWKHQIAAWHASHVSNGPTEAVNNLVKRVKRVAFGMTNFDNYRIRALLYAGRPNWELLATLTPR